VVAKKIALNYFKEEIIIKIIINALFDKHQFKKTLMEKNT